MFLRPIRSLTVRKQNDKKKSAALFYNPVSSIDLGKDVTENLYFIAATIACTRHVVQLTAG